jgi:hypothetical protein
MPPALDYAWFSPLYITLALRSLVPAHALTFHSRAWARTQGLSAGVALRQSRRHHHHPPPQPQPQPPPPPAT